MRVGLTQLSTYGQILNPASIPPASAPLAEVAAAVYAAVRDRDSRRFIALAGGDCSLQFIAPGMVRHLSAEETR